jgi:hypothetical protein
MGEQPVCCVMQLTNPGSPGVFLILTQRGVSMSKILAGFFVLALYAICLAAAATSPVTNTVTVQPGNVVVVKLGSDASVDTVYTSSGAVVYGPYNLSVDRSRPQFSGFRAYMPTGGLAAGDSVYLDYQILPGPNLSDSSSVWTRADTLINGKKGIYQNIASLPGVAIIFKITNADASKVGLIKKTKIAFIASSQESPDTKH